MSKLIGISLNEKFGILKAQEVQFIENNGFIEIKASVGSGKTTLKEAGEIAISAANKQITQFDSDKYKNVDVEVVVNYGEKPIYLRTYTTKSGTLMSTAYMKDENGKKLKDPVVNGKKLNPSILRDILRTDLTFGIDNFLSENPKVHMDFMMKIYSHKLKKLGVIFDKNSPEYKDSILWRLNQAILKRSECHIQRRSLNAFKESLLDEGYDELNVPELISIEKLESDLEKLEKDEQEKQTQAITDFYKEKEEKFEILQEKIDKYVADAGVYITKLKAYNDNIALNLKADIDQFNKEQDEADKNYNDLENSINILESFDYPCISELRIHLKGQLKSKPYRNYEEELQKAEKIPFTEDGKLDEKAFEIHWSGNVKQWIDKVKEYRLLTIPVISQKKKLSEKLQPETIKDVAKQEEIAKQIANAKKSNKIAERWQAFYDWQNSDELVKLIWKEYCELFAQIDLGVNGLKINIVGNEENSEIRTFYNGVHNPDFFGNTKLESRYLTQYSATQRPVIAILMQIYLLHEKLKKNEDGLRLMWIECPVDSKTRDLLISIQDKYDLDIIVGITGDFTNEGLEEGQFLIENGELLTLK